MKPKTKRDCYSEITNAIIADLEKGVIISDEDLKKDICTRHPYREWLNKHKIGFNELADSDKHVVQPEAEVLLRQQIAFGISREELETILEPMMIDGKEPIGSMGTDVPLAILSDHPQNLANYFKQLFAQVTNPPIDPIREKMVMANFSILGGFTGSGKTPILQQLIKSERPVIDLEKIACHKGSAFGALGEEAQPRQEMFENKLALELFLKRHTEKYIWLEDESQRVGQMMIPKGIWEQMRNSKVYFLDIPFEKRVEYLVSTYGTFNKEGLVNATMRIQKRLGGLETKNVINSIIENDFNAAFTILLRYYDKLYDKGLKNRVNLESLLTKISCESVNTENYKKVININN